MKTSLFLAGAMLAVIPFEANAAVDIYVSDNGTNSLFQVTGSLNLAGFTKITPNGTEPGSNLVQGRNSILFTGDPSQGLQAYTGLTNKNAFGNFNTSFADSGAGTGFGINGIYALPRLLLSTTYASGDAINSSATYLNKTIDTLGLIRGDYLYSAASDTITLHIGQSAPAVPEPATWGMMIVGMALIGGVMRRKQTVRTILRFT